ncbi:hypothetical protein E2320_007270 [Naja naja]|nr:hypothetical protein E2320_007270 [Naja naja]
MGGFSGQKEPREGLRTVLTFHEQKLMKEEEKEKSPGAWLPDRPSTAHSSRPIHRARERCLGAEPPPHPLTLSSLFAPPHRKGTDRLQGLLQLRLEVPGNRQLRTRRDWTAEGALQAHVGPVQRF